ncbi:MAG: DNA gyrase inhibitor YacG [Pseudomonadota bacterium]
MPTSTCPICGKPSVHAVRPFCSKRCADIDLHRWLGGHYAVPVVEEDGADEEPDPRGDWSNDRDGEFR